jgi:hypothetical protein
LSKVKRFKFPPPKDKNGVLLEPKEEFEGVIIEEVSKVINRPSGKWEPIIQALKFDDGSFGLRFWYRTVRPWGQTVTARGMYLKDQHIQILKNEIKKTRVIKSLLKEFIE